MVGTSLAASPITIVASFPLSAGLIKTSITAIGSISIPLISPSKLPLPTSGDGAVSNEKSTLHEAIDQQVIKSEVNRGC